MDPHLVLPPAEDFERLDKISRRQWRFVMARTFVADMGADILREILAAGLEEWRMQIKQIASKHSLKQDDVDWIFEYFQQEIRRRDRIVGQIHASRN